MKELWKYFEKHDHDVSIDECGIQQFFPNQLYAYNTYQNFVIHLVESGSGIFEVNKEITTLHQNDGFIVRKGQKIKYYGQKDDPWKNYWVGISGRHLDSYINSTILKDRDTLTFSPDSRAAAVIKEICLFAKQSDDELNNSIWYKFKVYELLYHLAQEFGDSNYDLKLPQRSYAEVAHDYISSNYNKNLTVVDVADFIGISRSYLYRLFKEKYDLSPQEYLLEKRLHSASKLLETTNDSIYEVSQQVGYDNQLLFSKNFRKHYGISPSKYRKVKEDQSQSQSS